MNAHHHFLDLVITENIVVVGASGRALRDTASGKNAILCGASWLRLSYH